MALVVSTLVVFAVTWALHSYQTFWIQGSFLLAWNDVLFWTLLAVLVVVNALHEWRKGRRRRLTDRAVPWRDTLQSAAATVGDVHARSACLWSLWSTESLATWISLWSAAATPPAAGQGWTVALLVAVPVAIALCVVATSRAWFSSLTPATYHAQAALVAGVATCLVLVSTSRVYKHLGSAGTRHCRRPLRRPQSGGPRGTRTGLLREPDGRGPVQRRALGALHEPAAGLGTGPRRPPACPATSTGSRRTS